MDSWQYRVLFICNNVRGDHWAWLLKYQDVVVHVNSMFCSHRCDYKGSHY